MSSTVLSDEGLRRDMSVYRLLPGRWLKKVCYDPNSFQPGLLPGTV